MLEISTKDYPGEYHIKSDSHPGISFIRTLQGAEFFGCGDDQIRIVGRKIYVSNQAAGEFQSALGVLTDYKRFVLKGMEYRIDINDQRGWLDLRCDNELIGTIEYQGYQRILFTEDQGWVRVNELKPDHKLAFLISLFSMEKEVRPSENG
jgi:hypothetical protein